MKCRALLNSAFVFLFALNARGQTVSPFDYHSNTVSVASPNASAITKYGNIPVNLFTGTPSIDIPLTVVKNGPIVVPISLSYHSGGIRVSELPGVAGLGWDLVGGGSITRKVNHVIDEFNNPNSNFQGGGMSDKGYFFTGSELDNSNWNTTTFLTAKLNAYNPYNWTFWTGLAWDGEPDEFQFNFNGYSGSFYRSEKGTWEVKSKQNLMLEITHEMAPLATYQLYKRFNAINDEETAPYGTAEIVSNLFTKFTIVTPDGMRYEFGGDYTAIEFSRGPRPEVLNNLTVDAKSNYITANTWNLRKITAPNGETMTFNYKTHKAVLQKSQYCIPGYADGTVGNSAYNRLTATAINPSYLASIETPLTRINFITSRAVELGPSSSDDIPVSERSIFKSRIASSYEDIDYLYQGMGNGDELVNFNRQLDSIKVFDKIGDRYTSGFKLFQRVNPNKRRTLDSLKQFSFTDDAPAGRYTFAYSNVDDLPGYESLRRDHYGYYNGATPPAPGQDILIDRTCNSLALYGLLTKITYPTGGETQFEFESSSYARAMSFNPNNSTAPIQLLNETGIAGVRVKKITHKDHYNATTVVKQYFYNKDFATGGTMSSGILGLKLPYSGSGYNDQITYEVGWGWDPDCTGTFSANNYSDNGSEWVSMSRGGIVTYSEVTERNSDGSFIVHKFSNHDQAQYRDTLHDNYAYADAIWTGPIVTVTHSSNFRLTSNDLERGNILSEESYNASGTKVKELLYSYTDDPMRKENYIKALAHKELYSPKHCGGGNYSPASTPRGWAYKIYCYANPLKTVTEKLFYDQGDVVTSKTYAYDVYGNIVKTETQTSDGGTLIDSTRYNSDAAYINNAVSGALYNLFHNKKIKNLPVEQVSYRVSPGSSLVTSGNLYSYNESYPVIAGIYSMELAAPLSQSAYTPSHINTSGNWIYDSRYQQQELVTAFSTNPNMIQGTKLALLRKTSTETYTWDYFTQFPTSVTRNAQSGAVAYTSFEGKYKIAAPAAYDQNMGNWDFDTSLPTGDGFTGKKCIRKLYSSHPGSNNEMLRTVFNLQSGKKYILSFWSKGAFPKMLQGTIPFGSSYTPANDWTYYEFEVTGIGQPLILQTQVSVPLNDCILDEVQLYPADAAMSSYTYDPQTGATTSVSNHQNVIRYYYDGLGRLLHIKDEKGNIIKQYSYQIQWQN